MELLKITKYLNFTQISDTGKTKLIGVGNNSGEKLGMIRWKPGWRRYAFEPNEGTIFDSSCMKEIVEFIDSLMDERKNILNKNNKNDE